MVALPVVTGAVDTTQLAAPFAGIDPYLVVGAVGTLTAAALTLRSGATMDDDTVESHADKRRSLTDMLRHGARETAFVTFWVAGAYLLTTWVIEIGGVDLVAVVSAAGIVGVLVGAGIGLVPGCAVQVVLTGLYATGVVPLATLAANALSQDGDALFPLIVMDRRAAVVATVITTVPGVVVGTAMIMAA